MAKKLPPRYRRMTPEERAEHEQWEKDSAKGIKTPMPGEKKDKKTNRV